MTFGSFPKIDGDKLWGPEVGLIGFKYPYGDGSDGGATITTTSWATPMVKNYTTCGIASGQTLSVTSGTIIYCTSTFTLNGSITITNIDNGGGGVDGNYGGGGSGSGGDSGGCIFIFAHDVAGSGIINSNGTGGQNGVNATSDTSTFNGRTGSSGTSGLLFGRYIIDGSGGGASGYSRIGGTATTSHNALVRNIPFMMYDANYSPGGAGGGGAGCARSNGAGGGGAGGSLGSSGGDGGAGAGDGSGDNGDGGGAGGGGAGGLIFVVTQDNNSTIKLNALGDNGGVGGNGETNGGGGGGGGGGSGGIIITFADNTNFVCTATGGTGGAGGTGNGGGTNGVNGQTGLVLEKTL